MAYQIGAQARCAVIGSGSWATALVKILLENQTRVGWCVRQQETVDYIRSRNTNPRYLRDVHFDPARLHLSTDIDEIAAEADLLVLATPSIYLKSTLEPLTVSLSDKFVVSAIKGIVPGELVTITEYVNRRYGVPAEQLGLITGPCHAEEVALERLSYLTACCENHENAVSLGEKIKTPYINVTPSADLHGAEYASVLKNIYAVGVGIATGLGYGDNYLAVLISNAALEMTRFLGKAYPAERVPFASAYLGDLLVTSYSQFSRNRRFGLMIGKGYSVPSIQVEMSMVAEGYYVSECLHRMNGLAGVEMPIAEAVHEMLYNEAKPRETLNKLNLKLF